MFSGTLANCLPEVGNSTFLLSKSGQSKVVSQCSYPVTGVACVKRIYTDLATLECTPWGLQLVDRVEGLSHAELEARVGLPIRG